MKRQSTKKCLVAACFVALLTSPVVVQGETIYGCCKIENGQLRVVGSPDDCLSSEIAMELSGSQIAPQEYVVDCEAGESVEDVLENAPLTGEIDIIVKGTCREAFDIHRDNVRIEGATPSDGFLAPDSDSFVIALIGAKYVELENLSITGGRCGLWAYGNSQFSAENLNISEAGDTGVSLTLNSSGHLEDCLINNNRYGVKTGDGASVWIGNCTIKNSEIGLQADSAGSIALFKGTVEENEDGVIAMWNGSVSIGGTVIQNNIKNGIAAMFQGSVILNDFDGAKVEVKDNGRNGLAVMNGSSANLGGGVSIDSNDENGVYVTDTSVAGIDAESITGNGGYGVFCQDTPSVAQVWISNPSVVSGNALGEINCP